MREKQSKSPNVLLGNSGAGTFLIVVGLGLIGIPFQDGVPLGLFHDFYPTLSFLLFELVGLAFFTGGTWFFVPSALGPPDMEASADAMPGEDFVFHYRQWAGRRVVVRAIDLFFVYREVVVWGKPANRSHYVFDRLISRQAFPGREFVRGDEIAVEAAFRVPLGEMGVRNPYMHIRGATVQREWVVRARVCFNKRWETWEDQGILSASPEDEQAQPTESIAQQVLTDVLLLPSPLERTGAIRDALAEVAPHLRESGMPYAQHTVPNLIRERVSEEEAEAIAERLRVAGAAVNIVPTEAAWWLPSAQERQAQTPGAANLSS